MEKRILGRLCNEFLCVTLDQVDQFALIIVSFYFIENTGFIIVKTKSNRNIKNKQLQ